MSEDKDSRGQETPPVDVQALLAQVDDEVRKKKESGFYDPAEVRRVEQAAVSFVEAAADGAAAELSLRHANIKQCWDPNAWGVATHRAGPAGKLILGLKKLIYKLTRFPASVWLANQTRMNDQMLKLLDVLVPQHGDLVRRTQHNETRLDDLEELGRQLGAGLNAGLNEMKRQLAEDRRQNEARLSGLERSASRGAVELEASLGKLQGILESGAAAGLAAPEAAQAVSRVRGQARGGRYLAFEDLHRGSREEIKERQAAYLPYFQEAVDAEHPLLDIGCGRGEFIEAAVEAGMAARGVDLNPEMVASCNQRGLSVAEGDAVEHLRSLPEESLGGILMAQLIEHLTLDQLTELVSLAASRLKPGGVLIAETVNPTCLTTFSGAFYLDLTHIKPIHPEAARFLWRSMGLGEVEVVYLSPYPEDTCLEELAALPEGMGQGGLREAVDAAARNFHRLNQLLYSYQDYAVVGKK